jgi:uncharacterized protein with PIN domain
MARLYADEDVPDELVKRLRLMGHDIVTVAEAGRCGGNDAQVLAHATADGRCVLTHNRWDFVRLHKQSSMHGGIISCTRDDDNLAALAARIDSCIQSAGVLAGQHLRVNEPP